MGPTIRKTLKKFLLPIIKFSWRRFDRGETLGVNVRADTSEPMEPRGYGWMRRIFIVRSLGEKFCSIFLSFLELLVSLSVLYGFDSW